MAQSGLRNLLTLGDSRDELLELTRVCALSYPDKSIS